MREIKIVGGGPAGLWLGIELRKRGVPVRVLEAGHYPRHKICGEFLAPRNRQLLEYPPLARLLKNCPAASSVAWYLLPHSNRPARFQLPSPARIVTRHFFDAALCEMLQEMGGQVETGARVAVETALAEGWVLASGRGKETRACRWIGLKAHFQGVSLAADLEMHTGRGAYVGLCEVSPGIVNVSGLFRTSKIPNGAGRNWPSLLKKFGLSRLAQRLEHAQLVPGSLCSVSHLRFGWNPCAQLLRVGDARAVIPPLAGNGLSLALETASLAADILECWSSCSLSWKLAVQEAHRACHRRLARRLRWAIAAQHLIFLPWAQHIVASLHSLRAFPWRSAFQLLGR